MDKITRLLMLYSKLINGEKVNKLMFCLETDCLPRSFDRDIEDIRLYLSEAFIFDELLYDRKENSYYLSNHQRQPLEKTEYLIFEQLLLDSRVLCTEELEGLLTHLSQNTQYPKVMNEHRNKSLSSYNEKHGIPILKMYGDLKNVIEQKQIIELNLLNSYEEVIPISIKYYNNEMILIALSIDDFTEHTFQLNKIVSFVVKRMQSKIEILKAAEIKKFEEVHNGKNA